MSNRLWNVLENTAFCNFILTNVFKRATGLLRERVRERERDDSTAVILSCNPDNLVFKSLLN